MNIQFGQIFYVWTKSNNENKSASFQTEQTKAKENIVEQMTLFSQQNQFGFGLATLPQYESHPNLGGRAGYLSRMITNEDTQNLLTEIGIPLSFKDSQQVNEEKIEAGLKRLYPSLTQRDRIKKLQQKVIQYTAMQEQYKQPITHIDLTA